MGGAVAIPKHLLFNQIASRLALSVSKTVVREICPGSLTAAITVSSSPTGRVFPTSPPGGEEATFFGGSHATDQKALDSAFGEAARALARAWKLEVLDHNYEELVGQRKRHRATMSWARAFHDTAASHMHQINKFKRERRKFLSRMTGFALQHRGILSVSVSMNHQAQASATALHYTGNMPPGNALQALSLDLVHLINNTTHEA